MKNKLMLMLGIVLLVFAGFVSASVTGIIVTVPNGGETFSGTSIINWTCVGSGNNLTISYGIGGTIGSPVSTTEITENITCVNQNYSWDTSELTDGTTYQIKLEVCVAGGCQYGVTGTQDFSDAFFAINNTIPPNQPTLNSPTNNSVVYNNHATLNITVTDDNDDYLNVSFYNDNGDISTASYLQNFSILTQESNLTGGPFFKPDGTKMYVTGHTNDKIHEYTLSTAWDISTAVYLQNFSIVEDTVPVGPFFKPDGTKMYVIGYNKLKVNEYDLSTAWDISTAVYLQNFSISTQTIQPLALFFKSDGTKMYVMCYNHKIIYEYDLSTAWNVTTASYIQSFSVAPQDTNPQGLFFESNGVKMYVVGNVNNMIYEYDLSTAWNVTTAVNIQNFSIGAQDLSPINLFFKPDKTKMYVSGVSHDMVYEYDLLILNTSTNISNSSYATYNWTNLANGDYEWSAIVTDGTGTTTSPVYSFNIYNYNYTTNYTTPVLETSSQTFTLNITRNSTYISNGNATLHWNGTAYPVNAVVYPTYLWFSKTLTLPSVSLNTNITFNWTYEFWNLANNSRETNRTEDFTQLIYKIGFDDCSVYSIVALNFSLIEESNNASIAGDMDFTFSLVSEGKTINYSKSVTGVNSTAFCISTNNLSFTAQLQSEYTASAYDKFTYFAYNLAITNTTQYIYYYLTNGTTIVTFTVQDQDSNDLQNAYIKVMKYDIGTGLYKTVEVLKTDEQGEALGNIVLDTAWYKFMVEYNGIVYLDTTATKMTTTARTFRINLLSDFFNRYTDVIYNIYSTLNYTDATGNFAFTYSDPSGDYHYGCLRVVREALYGQTLINETCVASTAATILVNVNSTGSVNGTYIAVGYILFDDKYVLQTLSKTWGSLSEKFGKEGLFYAFFIILVCVMVAVFSPKLAIILAIIGLIFTNILGFYSVNVSWLIVLIVGAVLTIYRMRAD